MVQAKTGLTLKEFLNLPPGEEDTTYELIDGQIIPKVSPKFFRAKLTHAFLNLIEPWSKGRGEICPEWATTLKREGRDWVPIPDLLYISYNRLPTNWDEDEACPSPPDLVIEIISPGQSFGQLTAKAQGYLNAGVLKVWVVDSKARSITVFYPDSAPKTYIGNQLLKDTLFEELEFTVEELFQRAKITKPGS